MLLALDPGVVGDIHSEEFARFLVAEANKTPVAGKNRPGDLCFVARCDLTRFVCGCVRDASKQNGDTRTKQRIKFPLTNIKFHCKSSKLVFCRLPGVPRNTHPSMFLRSSSFVQRCSDACTQP